jgi:1-phosphatidylinositol-3-phosphate 5-kinase
MLVYSPLLVQLDTRVCEHVTPLSDETAPGMRYNVVRLFGHGGRHVSFSLSPVEDVFELELPRFQIHTGALSKPVKSADTEDENKRVLRGEIKAWWQAIGDHLDELVS